MALAPTRSTTPAARDVTRARGTSRCGSRASPAGIARFSKPAYENIPIAAAATAACQLSDAVGLRAATSRWGMASPIRTTTGVIFTIASVVSSPALVRPPMTENAATRIVSAKTTAAVAARSN